MARNALIAAHNWFDSALTYDEGPEGTLYLDFVNDVYSFPGTNPLPVSNMAQDVLTKYWRTQSVNPNITWFSCDFGAARQVDVVALLNHNLTQSGLWRIRLSNDPTFNTNLYDSGLISAYSSVAGFGVKPWGVWEWGDPIGAIDLGERSVSAWKVLDAPVVAQYLRIDLSDAGNSAGYLQAARCIASAGYFPSKNIGFGWSIGYVDESQASRSLGGQVYIDERPRYRKVKFTLDYLNQDEAYLNLLEYVDRRLGTAKSLLFIPQPDRPDLYLYEAIYGRMVDLGDIVQPYPDVVSKSYVMEEYI